MLPSQFYPIILKVASNQVGIVDCFGNIVRVLAVAHGISLDACQAINDVSVRKHIHSFNNRVACDLLINTVSAIDHDSSIADRFDSGVLPDADAFRCNSGNFKRLDPVGVAFAEQFGTFRSDNLYGLCRAVLHLPE